MADITPSAVKPGARAVIAVQIAGAAITVGQVVYADPADSGRVKPCNTTTQAAASSPMIATSSQPTIGGTLTVQQSGIVLMSGSAKGVTYSVSGTGHAGGAAGGICPITDLTATEWITVLGTGNGVGIDLHIDQLDVQK